METPALMNKVEELTKTIQSSYATKDEIAQVTKQLFQLQASIKRKSLKETPDERFANNGSSNKSQTVFTKEDSRLFTCHLAKALLKKSEISESGKDLTYWKQAAASLNEEDSGYGGPPSYPMQDPGFVPNLIDPLVYKLVQSYGIARQYATFKTGIKGTLNLKARSVRAPVAYTTTGSPATSRADVTINIAGSSYNNNQLRPVQIAGLATVEEKLIFETPVDVVNESSTDLAESLALLEDQTLFLGDGTAAYGNVTGIKNNTNYTGPTLTATNFASLGTTFTDALFAMIPKVNPAVLSMPGTAFYMHPATFSVLQTSKASTSGIYVYDLRTQTFTLGGWPIIFVNAMDACYVGNATAGQMPVVFGNLAKAAVAGTGRDIEIRILMERYADNAEIGIRLLEDFGVGFPLYGASTGGQPISKVVLS